MQELPSTERLYSIRKDGSHKKLHPADVKGRWVWRRRVLFAALIAIYIVVPLLQIGGHPAVHLDIAARRFYLFGAAFNAQDTWIGIFLLASFSFGLLFFTAWLGRVWCGFACPQTVFLEGVFRPIERWIEGPGERRVRTDEGPWTASRAWRFVLKHFLFLAISGLLAHVALSFFVSPRSVIRLIADGPLPHLGLFLGMLAVTGLVYFNFMWFREQMCLIICPYGRLQSALLDPNSMIVGYDRKRGEPRGKKSDPNRGACVDCRRCVAVCPTGIDIRNGLQMECVACTQCIDACDEIMDKVEQPRGLIRFDSQAGFEGGERRGLRARLVAYGLLVGGALTGLVISLAVRKPFEANLVRQRSAPYQITEDAVINPFELHLINKNPIDSDFTLAPTLPDGTKIVVPPQALHLPPLGSTRIPIIVSTERGRFRAGIVVPIVVTDSASGTQKIVQARLLGPSTP